MSSSSSTLESRHAHYTAQDRHAIINKVTRRYRLIHTRNTKNSGAAYYTGFSVYRTLSRSKKPGRGPYSCFSLLQVSCTGMVPLVLVCASRKHRHYRGNPHYSGTPALPETYCHHWLFPSMPSGITGNLAGNRHYSIGTIDTYATADSSHGRGVQQIPRNF